MPRASVSTVMGEETRQLLDLIELVADGHGDIDWDAIIRDAPDDAARAVLRNLRTVAGVSHVHATQVADPATPQSTQPPGQDSEPTVPVVVPSGRWGNFRLKRRVGEGAYGEVYEAVDTFLDHRVALKLLKPNVGKSRILHEAKLLVGLRHPNVIAVHGADIREGRTGFWMDFIDGKTLADIVRAEKVRSALEAVVIGQDLCRALAAVHSTGIIHRDIKAQNVMRESGGRIVLMDFGAGEFADPARGNGRPAGTPLYLAPELFDGRPASIQSDLYALGVLLFFLVTGTFPYVTASAEALAEAHRLGKRRRLQDLRPDLPDAFVEVVDRMLAPDPKHRYESATETRAALESVVVPAPVPKPGPEPKPSAVRLWITRIVATLALVMLLGFVSTAAFNLTFGRTGAFGAETPLQWFVWGARLLLAPVVYVGIAVVSLMLAVAFVRVFCRLIPPLGAARARLFGALARFLAERELDDPNMLLQLVIGVGLLMFAGFVLVFWNDATAFAIYINNSPAEHLTVLQPANIDRFSHYSRRLEVCLFLFGIGAYGVYRIGGWTGRRPEPAAIAAAWAVPVLALILLRAMPYRVIFQNEVERVDLGDLRCYEIGHADVELLLHCPDVMPPRNIKVANNDPRLRRRGAVESVFIPRTESRAMK